MKVLWVNPSFLDYRIPVYKKLYELTNKDFFLVYSDKRVPERVTNKINTAIGANANGLLNEITFESPGKGDFANTHFRIPYQPGLYKAISKIDADVIIGEGFFQWTPMALLKAIRSKKKFFISYERTAHTERNCPKWRSFYRKIISKFVDGYLVNGILTKEYLLELGIKEDKIFIGGMSADSENLVLGVNQLTTENIEEVKAKLSIGKGITYLYVGQMIERKGVVHLLTAWKKHIENHFDDNLILIGTGPMYDQFRKDFSDYDSIKLLGSIDYDSIHSYYAIADVFIIPTLEDNWSLVVPEAMACSLPIACSIYNGCYPELVQDVNGKIFDPLNQESIVDTLNYFHGKDLKSMGKESARIEKNYNSDIVAEKIFESLKTVVSR